MQKTYEIIQGGAPYLAKLVYNSHNMVYGRYNMI